MTDHDQRPVAPPAVGGFCRFLALAAVLLLAMFLRLQHLQGELPYVYPDEWTISRGAWHLTRGELPVLINGHPDATPHGLVVAAWAGDWLLQRASGSELSWSAYVDAYEHHPVRHLLIVRLVTIVTWLVM